MSKIFNESDWPDYQPIVIPDEDKPNVGIPDVDLCTTLRIAA